MTMASKFANNTKWILLRVTALKLKSEIYQFRVRVGDYNPKALNSKGSGVTRQAVLGGRMEEISEELMSIGDLSLSQPESSYLKAASFDRYLKSFVNKNNTSSYKDDGISRLMPDQYVKARVNPEIHYYAKLIPKYQRTAGLFSIAIYVISTSSALLATLQYELWIPLIVAVTSSLQSVLEFHQYQGRVAKSNSSMLQLQNMRVWWRSLSPVEKASRISLRRLVFSTESILESEFLTWMQLMKNAASSTQDKKRLKKSNEDDEDEEEEDNHSKGGRDKDKGQGDSNKAMSQYPSK
ncbi:hypothetical protein CYMTET_33288 [Cymbomonas tetramitiformis]|uniref:SMODS and SLOG-associating 2TM effector domain-containing protein n=1 Tax=Cymbomonas tetramitiformis TaxID=36881 RepID=A0AAE0FDF5_9CHLO|nr:hypothetical protein CYMTET_33288 [Cymbomonas tetramitiformis]